MGARNRCDLVEDRWDVEGEAAEQEHHRMRGRSEDPADPVVQAELVGTEAPMVVLKEISD